MTAVLVPGSEARRVDLVRDPSGRLRVQRGRIAGKAEEPWVIILSPKKPEEAA